MDYPASVPGVGLVGGKFVDEDAGTGQVGSLIPAAWGNAVTDEILAVIQAAGLEPEEGDVAQLLAAITAFLRGRVVLGGTTTGAAPNFALALAPALAGYAEGQRLRIKFHAAGNGADVLNVSGLGNKSVKQYDAAGAKQAAVITAGLLADVEYDGVDFVVLDALPRGLEASSLQTFAATGTLPLSVVGGTAVINAAGATTQTLPAAASVPAGRRIELFNVGAGVATVSRAGANVITVGNSTVTSMSLRAGDSLTLESNGATGWYAVGGSAQLRYSGAFGGILSPTGCQLIAEKFILQWGVGTTSGTTSPNYTVTLPTTVNGVLLGGGFGNGWGASCEYVSATVSSLSLCYRQPGGAIATGQPVFWFCLCW